MRFTLSLSIFIILLTPLSGASPSVLPHLTLTIDPTDTNVTALSWASVQVEFNGTATMDKFPGTRFVVDLTASVDAGWAANAVRRRFSTQRPTRRPSSVMCSCR